MKRIWLLMMILGVLLCSCGKRDPFPATTGGELLETTSTSEDSGTSLQTTPSETIHSPETTVQEETTVQAETTAPFETAIGAYQTTTDIRKAHPFRAFMPFPGGGNCYAGKLARMSDYGFEKSKAWKGVRVRIVGMAEQSQGSYSIYYIQVMRAYGMGDVDTDQIYSMLYYGTPENPLYGRPVLEIGKDYFRLNTRDDFMEYPDRTMEATLMLPILEQDGVEYVYGYGIDLGGLSCSVAVTDAAENQIYKQGIHDAEIREILADGEALPTFDYKCELAVMVEALCR